MIKKRMHCSAPPDSAVCVSLSPGTFVPCIWKNVQKFSLHAGGARRRWWHQSGQRARKFACDLHNNESSDGVTLKCGLSIRHSSRCISASLETVITLRSAAFGKLHIANLNWWALLSKPQFISISSCTYKYMMIRWSQQPCCCWESLCEDII